jgi:hypothetical protein
MINYYRGFAVLTNKAPLARSIQRYGDAQVNFKLIYSF